MSQLGVFTRSNLGTFVRSSLGVRGSEGSDFACVGLGGSGAAVRFGSNLGILQSISLVWTAPRGVAYYAAEDALIIGGTRASPTNSIVARYDADGSLAWSTLLGPATTSGQIWDVLVYGGYIYAAGLPSTTWPGSGGARAHVWKIDPADGSIIWGANVFATERSFNRLAADSYGLYLSQPFPATGSENVRISFSTGVADWTRIITTFGSSDYGHGVAPRGDGGAVVGAGNEIRSIKPDGTVDTPSLAIGAPVLRVRKFGGGYYVITNNNIGWPGSGGVSANVFRVDTGLTTVDRHFSIPSFASNTNGRADVTVGPDGSVYIVGGNSTSYGGLTSQPVANAWKLDSAWALLDTALYGPSINGGRFAVCQIPK